MSERRRPTRASGVAEGVAAAVRRRQRDREPRVLLYDPTGDPRVIAPSAPGYDELLDTAQGMVEIIGAAAEPGAEERA